MRLRRGIAALACVLSALWISSSAAQLEGAPLDLMALSIEELMGIEVTLVSRKEEKLFEAPAAVFALTREDIRRSGATNIPDVLRLVPGLVVAHIDANKWAISARGFNGRFAQRLLVQIDGRSVYTPLFSGVFWEVQDVLLEDVERIEVIRGPGATLWGANAVNGIINIVTRSAQDSQGGLAAAGGGTEERAFGRVRYGGRLRNGAYYRIYGKYFDRDGFVNAAGRTGADDWDMARGGFRVDWDLQEKDALTIQGDLYGGDAGQRYRFASLEAPYRIEVEDDTRWTGGNVLARWRRVISQRSDLALQLYYDRSGWDGALLEEIRNTYDVDFQHRFMLGQRQEVVWGAGYRHTRDDTEESFVLALEPAGRGLDRFSLFAQDDIELVGEKLHLIAGSKFEHNDYTGFEFQPTARLLWTPRAQHTAWAAASRAVRIPSRADEDVRILFQTLPPDSLFAGSSPVLIVGVGGRDFKAEKLNAYEMGYRFWPRPGLVFDLAAFYNDYADLRSGLAAGSYTEEDPAPVHLVIPFEAVNLLEAETYGVEVAADWHSATLPWRCRAAYSYLEMQLHVGPGVDPVLGEGAEGESPAHQFYVWSSADLRRDIRLDGVARFVDRLPWHDFDAYLGLDLRLAWEPVDKVEIALVGRDLLDAHHPEFRAFFVDTEPTETQRSAYATLSWTF